jgi:hypothetical protein
MASKSTKLTVIGRWFEVWFYPAINTAAFPPTITQFPTLDEAVAVLKQEAPNYWLIEQFSYTKYVNKDGEESIDRAKGYFVDVRFKPMRPTPTPTPTPTPSQSIVLVVQELTD